MNKDQGCIVRAANDKIDMVRTISNVTVPRRSQSYLCCLSYDSCSHQILIHLSRAGTPLRGALSAWAPQWSASGGDDHAHSSGSVLARTGTWLWDFTLSSAV